MSSFINDKLFPVIRAGMDIEAGSKDSVALTKEDCETLRRLGIRQDITPVMWRGLKKQNLPDEWLTKIEENKTKCMYKYVLREDTLDNICTVLEDAHIAYIVLKGAAFKHLYPEEWMRTSLDIDILVHEEDLEDAIRAVKKNSDFREVNRTFHDVSLINKSIQLELHFSIKESMSNIDAVLERVWSYAEPAGSGYRYELTPEFSIFYTVAHMAYHMLHGGVGIRSYIDLWLLKNKTDNDDDIVRDMCGECDILRFYDVCCDVIAVWFEGADIEIPEELVRYCLTGGAYGDVDKSVKTKQIRLVGRHGFSYIIHRIFVGKTYLQRKYPQLESKPYLYPYYLVCRWVSLLKDKKYNKAKKEIDIVKNTSKEDTDKIEIMLREIGL